LSAVEPQLRQAAAALGASGQRRGGQRQTT
jgi:ABC-type phosphate transport system permease subunit